MRKESAPLLQRWPFWSRMVLSGLVSVGVVCLGGPFPTLPAAAKTKTRVPPKGASAPAELPYEKRLQLALELTQQKKWQQAAQTIGRLDGSSTMSPVLGRLWFLRATLAQKLQDPTTAVQAFTRVWQTYPPLADYASWEIAQHYAAQDCLPELQTVVTSLTTQYPYSRLVPNSLLLLARTQHRLAQTAEARTTLEHLLDSSAEHPTRPDALAFLGQIYADNGEFLRAFELLQRLGETYPRHPLAAGAFAQSRRHLSHLPDTQHPRIPPASLLASIDGLAEAQLWEEVEARLALVSTLSEPAPVVVKVLLKRAAVALRRQRHPEAVGLLQELVQRFPKGSHIAEAQYLLSIVRQRQGQRVSLEPSITTRLSQPFSLAWFFSGLPTLTAVLPTQYAAAAGAEEYYQRLVRDQTPGEAAARQVWLAGWEQYRRGSHSAAERLWSEFESRFPRSSLVPQVFYWQARAAVLNHRFEVALRLYQRLLNEYPIHYYSRLAAASLQTFTRDLQHNGITVSVPDATPEVVAWTQPRPPAVVEAIPGQPTRERFHYIRVQELQRLYMHSLAAQEVHTLAPLLPNTPPVRYFLATLFSDNQEHAPVLRLLSGLIEAMSPPEVRGVPRTLWTMLYPRAFWTDVAEQSQRFSLNPYLILSMMRQESTFDPTATSPVGARGLMQLMPATAQEVAARVSSEPIDLEQLYEPQWNVMLGTRYFSGLLQRYQGNIVLALAAYNAGPGRVTQWLAQWANLSIEEFIEHIPFEETRAYVKHVLRNLMLYERLYPTS